jgi:hypothetical protein
MEGKIVKQYTGRLNLPNHTIVNLEGAEQGVLKETAQAILKGGCRFEPTGPTGGTLIVYHPTFDAGKTPIGWISGFDVPETMSVLNTVAQFERQAA